jgi:hypothetical protein
MAAFFAVLAGDLVEEAGIPVAAVSIHSASAVAFD